MSKVKGISYRYDKARNRHRLWFHINKQAWSEQFPDRAHATRAAAGYARALKQGEDIRPKHLRETPATPKAVVKPGSVRALGNKWIISEQAARSVNTNESYAYALTHYIYPVLGDVMVTDDELTREVCRDFVRTLRDHHSDRVGGIISEGTRKAVLRTLSSFCTWVQDEYPAALRHNPAVRLRKYTRRADELTEEIVFWTPKEVERLLSTCLRHYPHWYPYLYIAIYTGLRGGELIELRWDEDFDFPGFVYVQRQALSRKRRRFQAGADGALTAETDPAVVVKPTKGRETRKVPLRPDVQLFLQKHRKAQLEAALKAGQPAPALCLLSPEGERVILGNFRSRVLAPLCKKAKVRFTSKGHATRHTYATALLMGGVRVDDVSRWLGHKDETITIQIYKHHIRDTQREAEAARLVERAWAVKQDGDGD